MGIYSPVRKPISEAYFGTSTKVEDTLKQLGKFREKYAGKGKFLSKFNTDPELLEFNRAMEDLFGFELFSLVIEPEATFNACTFPLNSRIDTPADAKKFIETTKDGYHYKKEAGFSCIVYINSSLITNEEFSDREVFAIILHEVGHNFQGSLSSTSMAFGYFSKVLNLVSFIILACLSIIMPFTYGKALSGSLDILQKRVIKTSNSIKKEKPWAIDVIYKAKGIIAAVSNVVNNIFLAISDISIFGSGPLATAVNALVNKIYRLAKNPLMIFKLIFGFNDEKVSDNFATMYGYGPELASSLGKMEDLGYGYAERYFINKKVPFLGQLVNLMQLPTEILVSPLDEHPRTIARAKDQLDLLQNELLKEDLDPKAKKYIKSQIDELQTMMTQVLSYDTKVSQLHGDDALLFSKSYSSMLLNLSGGDIRNGLYNNKKNFDNYDQIEDETRV